MTRVLCLDTSVCIPYLVPEVYQAQSRKLVTEALSLSIRLVSPAFALTFHVMWKSPRKPNPLTPFPCREGGKFKVSLLLGERFRERFFRYRESELLLGQK